MSLLRTSLPRSLLAPATRPAASRMTLVAARGYASGPGGSDAGATASSGGFKAREQGQEKEYILRTENEKLKKLREQLAKQRKHIDDVEAAINDLSSEEGSADKKK